MDKMTDAKIRAWLNTNQPGLLDEFQRYQSARLAADPEPAGDGSMPFLSLREWLMQHHPDIIERIALW
jgi:hypothetical protein